MQALLFCLGLALGSFLHVLASRYDPDRFLLTRQTLGGRSYCPGCKKTLAWYELIPLVSFLIQGARCRSCGAKIGWSYFFVELASGLIVAFAPLPWNLVFLVLLLITLIDIRLQIIPDELTVALIALGLWITAASVEPLPWASHLGAAFGAALFFAGLIAITRGKGMGVGDVKLGFALGVIFGWPAILLLLMLAFIIGAIVGVALIAARSKNLKSAVPFGPFLAIAAAIVFLFGPVIIQSWYNFIV
jgi:prepilin signal peptidase PulO-like enzyme (type II secretory pathway)